MAGIQITEGDITSTVYGLIKDERYLETVEVLESIGQQYSKSRPALSLLGYCYYQLQDFVNAADCYEQLTLLNPEVEEYRLYYAQSLYKASLYEEAMKVSSQIEETNFASKILQLQAGIKYYQGDYVEAQRLVEISQADDPDFLVNLGCLLFKKGKHREALQKFLEAEELDGEMPSLLYNIALCHYMMEQFKEALNCVGAIIRKGISEHPELAIGTSTDGIELQSVGNTLLLHESALIEAFNLQAAIEFQLKDLDLARMALMDMPPRSEKELDSVTLHNHALINMETNPTEGLQKLQYLLQQDSFPPETFANLLLLYVKYEYDELAADVMAENTRLQELYLNDYLYSFLEATIMRQRMPIEAFQKLDVMADKLIKTLRQLSKKVEECQRYDDDDTTRMAVQEYDQTLEKYIPVLMQQAKIYWDKQNYEQVEKLLEKSSEVAIDHYAWKMNFAHVHFMLQTDNFQTAVTLYEDVLRKCYTNNMHLLNINAAVLANLCASYVLVNKTDNREAELLIQNIETAEPKYAMEQPDKKLFHLCIAKLVIGTMYCSRGKYDFGISQIMKSMEPFQTKLNTETWFYTKRCFLSLLENSAKQLIMLEDQTLHDSIAFLELCELYGQNIVAQTEMPLESMKMHLGQNTVSYEARLLKALILKLMGF